MTLDAGADIILDADGGDIFVKDAGTTFGSLTNSSGNLIIKSGTTTSLTFTGANVAAAGDFDIDGTTNLDAVDIDGAVQIDGTITVGVDDTGYDVKLFGATSGSYLLWDESNDDLILGGAARLGIGTTSPQRSLEISAAIPVIRITDTDSSAGYMEMGGAGSEFKFDLDKDDALASSILTFKVDGSYVMKFRDGASEFADGTAAAPSITNIGDTNTGFLFSAADTMQFSSGGTAQFTMENGAISPVTDNDIDLGTSSLEFKNVYVDGTVFADALGFGTTAMTVPSADGSANQILETDGSGTLSFVDKPSSGISMGKAIAAAIVFG